MTDVLEIADVNEFHALTSGVAYAEFSPVCITRVTYSNNHVDNQFAAAVDQMVAGKLASRGFYAFVVPGVDPTAQGIFFAQTLKAKLGTFLPTDFISFDIEQGSGDLAATAQAFLNGVRSVLHEALSQDFGYSGSYFWTAHLSSVNNVHRWIAAYGQLTPPPLGEALWQSEDNASVPGVAGLCDLSKFNGTLAQFLALIMPSIGPAPQEGEFMSRTLTDSEAPNGTWVLPDQTGAVYAYDGAAFLGGCNGLDINPGPYPCVGIESFVDASGQGYTLILDWGSPTNNGHSADGGDRFRRYHFPRSNLNKPSHLMEVIHRGKVHVPGHFMQEHALAS